MPSSDGVKRPNTLVFNVPEELRNGSRDEFVEKIVAALPRHEITAVQFVPGYFVRVTFRREQSRHEVFNAGFSIDGTAIHLVEADSTVRLVYVHHCPVEVPDSAIRDVLSEYGNVMSIQPGFHKGTTILNGSLVVKMSVTDEIPSKLHILRYPCRVWYRDQTQLCHICEKPGHLASKCPLRDLCRKCRQPGHFARNCRADRTPPAASADPPPAASDRPASPTDASPAASAPDSVDADPPPPDDCASDSSDCMEAEELAPGDEEVLANAPPLTGSPRRTRSSTVSDSAPDSASLPTFPPSGVPVAVPDVPVSDMPPSSALQPPASVRMHSFKAGCFPPKFSGPFPVRDVPADLRNLLLTRHSACSAVINEDFAALDGSSTVTVHHVFDFGVFTSAVLKDEQSFESVREAFYSNCRASKSVSSLSPPVCSAMPGASPAVDLPPLPSCVFSSTFLPAEYDSEEDAGVVVAAVLDAALDAGLDALSYTRDDIVKLLPPEFSLLSEQDQTSVLYGLCTAECRDLLAADLEDQCYVPDVDDVSDDHE